MPSEFATPKPYAGLPVIYPIVVGTAFKIFGYSLWVPRGLNVFFFLAAGVTLFLTTKRLTNLATGILSAILFAFSKITFFIMTCYTELLAIFLLTVFLYIISKRRLTNFRIFSGGIVMGLLTASRYMFLFPSLVLAISFFIFYRKRVLDSFSYLLGLSLILIPVILYNITTLNRPLPFGTQASKVLAGSYSFWILQGKDPYPRLRKRAGEVLGDNFNYITESEYYRSRFKNYLQSEFGLNNFLNFIGTRIIQIADSTLIKPWEKLMLVLPSFLWLYWRRIGKRHLLIYSITMALLFQALVISTGLGRYLVPLAPVSSFLGAILIFTFIRWCIKNTRESKLSPADVKV